MQSCVFFALALAAVAFGSSHTEDFSEGYELLQDVPAEENLLSAVHEMRQFAPKHLQEHVKVVAHHAELIQDSKAKAYAHDFTKSQAAIKAALSSLNAELESGHAHDVEALKVAKASGNKVVSDAGAAAKTRVRVYRDQACPTKRAEESADAKKQAAKKKMDAIADNNICGGLSTTWGDMDIDKSTAKYGTALRNGWDKVRTDFVKAKVAHSEATKAHNAAIAAHERSMAGFKTALGIEAQNVLDACRAAHKQYNVLVKDVQSNVNTRKQTYVAGLVIRCYVDNITSNSGAKTCADRARSADVSRWNINGGTLHPCASKVANENSFGPKDWTATPGNCKGAKERNGERSSKEKASKEVKAKEASAKEKEAKKVEKERTDKERAAKEKEREAKAKVERDNKATKERKAKADEKKAKADEKVAKEKSSKEASAKAAAKEKTDKANEKKAKAGDTRNSFTCATRSTQSNNAGVIYIGAHSGYTTTGGGMYNIYRSWNAKSAFEEMMPEGDRFRCDTGFGPGQLICYSQSCKVNGGLSCGIWSGRFTGSGSKTVNVPSGYTMTGGGLYNHYRSFNQKAGFEESYPHGNGWKGDMGFGWGDYTVYVRGCKVNKAGHSLSCTNAVSGRGNSGTANCPGGYKLTGCGMVNHYRSWDQKAGFEQTHPHGNGCLCDSGFGYGDMQCYARCCKVN
jgi:membrane protein involved in colicin uptake